MTTMLVASAGGHITQLANLRARLSYGSPMWVTYGVPSTEPYTAGDTVIHAHHPTTKDVSNAVRNYRLARRVFAEHDIRRVVSTGSAVAVPFMLRARQLGIPCHYIESATRVIGPSLSGRMIQRLRGAHLYRQLGDWGHPRWMQGPCVFDGFKADQGSARPVRRILVSLGTHGFAFTSLIDRLADLLGDPHLDVTWQLSSTAAPAGLRGRVHELLSPDELQFAIREADVVVGHAGVGLTLTCLQAGKVPVLVPRRRARREHTDDHQQQLAGELDRQGLAVAAQVGELTFEHLERAAELVVNYDEPPPFELID